MRRTVYVALTVYGPLGMRPDCIEGDALVYEAALYMRSACIMRRRLYVMRATISEGRTVYEAADLAALYEAAALYMEPHIRGRPTMYTMY
jgi:hypothetical protein